MHAHALLDDDDDNAMITVNELCYPVEKLRIGEDKNWHRASNKSSLLLSGGARILNLGIPTSTSIKKISCF